MLVGKTLCFEMSVFNNTLVMIMLSLTPTDYAPKPPILLIGGFDEGSPTHRTVFDEISTNKAQGASIGVVW